MNRKITKPNLSNNKRDLYIFLTLLFLLSASYFYFFGNSLFFYQENRSLFIFSREYFGEFLLIPGGLTEYIGNFIKQVYYSNIYGSLVVSVFLLLFAAILIRMYKILSGGKTVWFIIITGPACLLLLMQTLNDHFIHYTIGYLFLTLFMQASVYFSSKRLDFLVPILFPIFFYLAGSLALVFPVFYAIYCLLYKKGSSRFIISGILVVVAVLSLLVFQKFLFLQAPDQYLKYPLPIFNPKELHTGELILCVILISFPLISRAIESLKFSAKSARLTSQISSVIVLFTTMVLLGALHNSEFSKSTGIEKLFFHGEWDKVIENYEKEPVNSIVANYYYNLALSEKGQLCDRLFYGSQDFGKSSFVLARSQELNRSMYYYYTIGFINEAHHMAFESMVLNGYRPENVKMLIKTDLINGNYKSAEKYIKLLKRTLHYRKWTKKYERMLDSPAFILSDTELGAKNELLPRTDFYITQDDVINIDLMLMSNQDNKLAFEYKLARLLLEKDYKAVVYQVKRMKYLNYPQLPRHVEEAIMLFIHHNFELPYLGEFEVSEELRNNFDQFLSAIKENRKSPDVDEFIQSSWGNTFWYYNEFK